jgi:hypothetical protein
LNKPLKRFPGYGPPEGYFVSAASPPRSPPSSELDDLSDEPLTLEGFAEEILKNLKKR